MNRRKWAVVTDFDGTITLKDVSDKLLVHFKAATKEEIELSYDPRVKMEEWMKKYFRPLAASKEEIEAYVLSSASLRAGFKEFAAFCSLEGVPLEIASGGVDLYIDCLLKKWGLKIKSFYGRARFTPGGIQVSFPCLKGAALDEFKSARVRHYQRLGYGVAFCGDGTSDLKAARSADAVFATKRLRRYCLEKGVRNRQLKNFFSVRDFIGGSGRDGRIRP